MGDAVKEERMLKLAEVLSAVAAREIKWPAHWAEDESKKKQEAGKHFMNSAESVEDTVESLIAQFGVVEAKKKTNKKKRAEDEEDDGEEGAAEGGSPKKVKKTETVAVEENRDLAYAIKEMADWCFKAGDPRKGGVYSKAAKAIREATYHITSGKQTLKGSYKLPGVGKGIAEYIEEFINSGTIVKLEKLRAGEV